MNSSRSNVAIGVRESPLLDGERIKNVTTHFWFSRRPLGVSWCFAEAVELPRGKYAPADVKRIIIWKNKD